MVELFFLVDKTFPNRFAPRTNAPVYTGIELRNRECYTRVGVGIFHLERFPLGKCIFVCLNHYLVDAFRGQRLSVGM